MFNKEEKDYLKIVVKRELERFIKERVVTDETIVFLKSNEKYEAFLRDILKKLEE